jgi:peptide/nickel transport system permease protein
MVRLIASRLAGGLLTLLVASILIFAVVEVLPGDAATAFLGRDASEESVAALREEFGLNRPVTVRYLEWISGFASGDLGSSVANGVPVSQLIGDRLLNSAVLGLLTFALLVPLSLFIGTITALRRGSKLDTGIQVVTLATAALPEFVVGIGLIFVFVYLWPVLPAVSLEISPSALILPTASLLLVALAFTARMVRAGVIDVLQSDHVAMARLKGVPERLVIRRHVLPNALVPAAQALVLTAAWMAGGIVIIEFLFGYPGIGEGFVQAVSSRDAATVESLTLILVGIYVVANLVSDVFAVLVTPRLRTQVL